MITQDLGIATAYGYAKSKGYTGTEAEFAELMASYASTAQTAIEAADRAVEANTAAQSAKTSAQSSASTASTAAQTATSKASEAVTAAGTATTKASEASQSASTASTAAQTATDKASEATTAASTATAKASEAAVSANTATTAKTDAETARDAAAQSASEAAASAESIDPDEFDRKIYAAFATDTASGAIAHFTDGADNIPMKDVLVHIEPVQAGSGDPSPDNVRPITGWTGAKVTRCGKNLWTFNDSYSASGHTTLLNRVPFNLYPGTYTFSAVPNIEADTVVLFGYHEDGTRTEISRLHASTTRSSSTATVSKPVVSLYFVSNESGTISNIQLELGSTATDYEPYSGQTYDITFPTEAGTVYGGQLNVTTGELTVDRVMVDLPSDMSWDTWGINYKTSGITGFYIYRHSMPSTLDFSNIGKAVLTNLLAIHDLAWAGSNVGYKTNASGESSNWYEIVSINNETASILSTDTYAEAIEKFKAFLESTPLNVLYELVEPITYQLTTQEITSLLGENNVWADTGDSEVEYRADTKLYVDNKIAELQALVLENNGGN